MSKANLVRDAWGRQDPKSLVFQLIPNLHKSFRQDVRKNVYWETKDVIELETGATKTEVIIYQSLQHVIDAHCGAYAELEIYATKRALEELAAFRVQEQLKANKNIPIEQIEGRKAYEYWECGGCQEDFWHPWTDPICPACGDTAEGAQHACLEDVIMASCPIDWKAQEKWEADGMPERPEAQGKTDPGDELAKRYYAGQIDSLGNPT